MEINSNNTKLLADILAYAILIEFEDVDLYDEFSDEIIIEKTKNDIIQLAEQLLPQELFNEYSEFKKSNDKE
mgnify:CR=1 FL=1